MLIRREDPADVTTVRTIHVRAFGDAEHEPVEAGLLDALRRCEGWMPELSWVAEIDGAVVGHVVSTRSWIGDTPCVGLGPIGVEPSVQHTGVGLALMHASIGAADAIGEPAIGLLGSPDYYHRFGFVPATSVGVEPPEAAWGDYFQLRPLHAWSDTLGGLFRYADPFDHLD